MHAITCVFIIKFDISKMSAASAPSVSSKYDFVGFDYKNWHDLFDTFVCGSALFLHYTNIGIIWLKKKSMFHFNGYKLSCY